MTYPPSSPGYSPTPPTTQFSVPTQQFSKAPESAPAGPSKLPLYLAIAVTVLGLAVYLSSFGPQFTISNSEFPQLGSASGSTLGLGIAVLVAIVSALVAGVTLLPKQNNYAAVAAVAATLAFLLVIGEVINAPSGATIDWALYLVIAFSLLQTIVAVAWLLLESGVITAPVPKPKYDQQQYNPYGAPGGYYGQPQGQPQGQQPQGPQQHGGSAPQQRPSYPPQYGQSYQGGQSTGGFPTAQQHSGPPTPPTGFPTYGHPQASATTGPQAQQSAQPQQPAAQQSATPPS
jgi:hypothetical protein